MEETKPQENEYSIIITVPIAGKAKSLYWHGDPYNTFAEKVVTFKNPEVFTELGGAMAKMDSFPQITEITVHKWKEHEEGWQSKEGLIETIKAKAAAAGFPDVKKAVIDTGKGTPRVWSLEDKKEKV